MDPVRVSVTVEVEQEGNGLRIRKPVPLRLVYEHDQWHAECDEPCVRTEPCPSMEQAVVAGARQAGRELQAAVIERPVVAGRISPDMIPQGSF